jgi:hypothetical protein
MMLVLTALAPLLTLAGVVFLSPAAIGRINGRIVNMLFVFLVVMPGMMVMMLVHDCFPPFWPFMTGALLALAFAALAMILLLFHRRMAGLDVPVDIVQRFVVCMAVGALYVQPLVLMVNGFMEGAVPRLVPGVVTRTYQTHGKGAANYVVLNGPAAALGNTNSDGEFSVDAGTFEALRVGSMSVWRFIPACCICAGGLLRPVLPDHEAARCCNRPARCCPV